MNNHYKIIAIDGPSGSGKGTVARAVAKKLQFSYLDSGAIYRALAFLVIKNNLSEANLEAILALIVQMKLFFKDDKIFVNGEDVTQKLRGEEVGMLASYLGKLKPVRVDLLQYQRDFASRADLVTDGRDMGSVVFPSADLKIFLTASVQRRAERRFKELHLVGKSVKMEAILQGIILRDKQDSEREVAPLKFTSAYKLLDNTDLTVDECVERIIFWYHQLD